MFKHRKEWCFCGTEINVHRSIYRLVPVFRGKCRLQITWRMNKDKFHFIFCGRRLFRTWAILTTQLPVFSCLNNCWHVAFYPCHSDKRIRFPFAFNMSCVCYIRYTCSPYHPRIPFSLSDYKYTYLLAYILLKRSSLFTCSRHQILNSH